MQDTQLAANTHTATLL